MSDNEQDFFANEICPLNYEPHYIFNQPSFSHFGGFLNNSFEEDNYYQLSFSDDTQSVNDTSQNLKKAIENIFPFNNNKEKDDTINIQNTHQNKKEEPLNASELPAIEEFKQIKEREEKSEIFQDYENYDSEKKNKEKEESIKEEEPKSKTANQIKFQELSKEEQNLCINKKRKRKVSKKFIKRRKNVNSNNESKKKEIFITRKINTSEGLKFIVGQYIYDKIKEETKNENTELFGSKLNTKLKDVLEPYINKLSKDKMKKKLKKDYEFSTTSKFIKKLLNKKEGKNKKRKLTKPQIKQIFRIVNSIKTPKKVKKKKKKINGSNENITMINHESLKNSILKFDDKSVNNNLLDDNSNKISSFKIDILGNSEKNKILFPININDGNTTNGESNIRSNKQGKSEDKRDGIEIRNDHLKNRIKNMIWDEFFEIFNLVNKSYKLKKIKEEDDNDDDEEEEEEEEEEKEEEEEEEEEEEKEEKSENKKVLVGILKEIEELEKNAKEIKENEQGDIILYISKENNNNKTKKDYKFMKTSFEKIIDMAKKRQHLEGLEESEKAKKLIKIKKNVFLKKILANTKLSKKIFDKIQKEKENQWKNDICRNIKNEIAKRKDLDGLVNILCTKEKDSFINEIKKLGGYEKMIPSCEDINDNIQIYMKLLKETAGNLLHNLKKKNKIIKEKEKEKEKKLKK